VAAAIRDGGGVGNGGKGLRRQPWGFSGDDSPSLPSASPFRLPAPSPRDISETAVVATAIREGRQWERRRGSLAAAAGGLSSGSHAFHLSPYPSLCRLPTAFIGGRASGVRPRWGSCSGVHEGSVSRGGRGLAHALLPH
jgi:hypothetical protein